MSHFRKFLLREVTRQEMIMVGPATTNLDPLDNRWWLEHVPALPPGITPTTDIDKLYTTWLQVRSERS